MIEGINYDYEFTNDSHHYISIFEVKSGKTIDYAESTEEAVKKIRKLEDEFIPKELQRDYDKTFGHNRH